MKKKFIFIAFLAIALVSTTKAQNSDMFAFANVKTAKVVNFELEGYPWVQTVDTINPGQLILKANVEEKKLFFKAPSKKNNEMETEIRGLVVGTTLSLEQNTATIEIVEVNRCNYSAKAVIVIKLDGEDMGTIRLLIARFLSL